MSSKPRRASYLWFTLYILPPTQFFPLYPTLTSKLISKSILQSRYDLRLKIYIPRLRSLHRTSAPQLPRSTLAGHSLKYYPPTHSLVTTGCYLTVPAQPTTSTRAQNGDRTAPSRLFDLSAHTNPPPPPQKCRGKSQRVRVHSDLHHLRRLPFADLVALLVCGAKATRTMMHRRRSGAVCRYGRRSVLYCANILCLQN